MIREFVGNLGIHVLNNVSLFFFSGKMSADLQWAIIRNSASSIVKRNGLVLSRDPLNVMNVHSFKYR
jgi:hypothetical protein